MFRKLSIAAAIASVLLIPAAASAAQKEKATTSSHVSGASRAHVSRSAAVTHVTRSHVTTRSHVATRGVGRATNGSARNDVRVSVRIGGRYNGGVWYGHRRHFWQGRWYTYGIGPCWLMTPIGYVWTCG